MKRFLFFALMISGIYAGSVKGQQYPHYSNYLFNPYAYNPAAAGNNEQMELNLTYRQQWLGIQDAPVTQSFNFQMPLKDRVSIGVNFFHDQTVLLNTSALMAAFAYTVPIEKRHFVKFGLSAGIGVNNFDMDEIGNTNDPALLNALNQSSFMTGQFGIWYYNRGLKLGFSLPQLYKYTAVDTVEFQSIQIDRFDNFILSASKSFDIRNSRLAVEPFVVYRKNELQPSVVEGGGMVSYDNIAWLGTSYSNRETLTAYIGIQILDNIRFNYAYEHTTGGYYAGIGNGSHEISLKIGLGKGRSNGKKVTASTATLEKKRQTVKKSRARGVAPKKETENQEIIQENETLVAGNQVTEGTDTPAEEIASEPAMKKGYHLVFNAFENETNAIEFAESLQARRIPARIHYIPERQMFYVHAYNDADKSVIMEKYKHFRKQFTDIWIYKVD